MVNGANSLGICRHWHPVVSIYRIAFMIVRSETERGLPRGWHLGIKGSISAHSGSVKSLASRSPSRQFRGRVISVQAIVILSVVVLTLSVLLMRTVRYFNNK